MLLPGRLVQSVTRRTLEPEIQSSILGPVTSFRVSLHRFKKNHLSVTICFGFNGPLRQYFNLYRVACQRGRWKRENNRREKEISKQPHQHLLQAQYVLILLLSKLVGLPALKFYPAPSQHPTSSLSVTGESMCTKY